MGRFWLGPLLVVLALATASIGCRRSVKVEGTVVDPLGAQSARAVRLPAVTQTLAEVRAELAGLDQLSSKFDDARLKMAILQDGRRKEHGVEGFEQRESWAATYNSPTAAADSATRRVAWRAMTCFNPACRAVGKGGGPFLFTVEWSWVTYGSDGKLRVGQPDWEEGRRPIPCPACGSPEYVRAYDLPETLVRERELRAELMKSYNALVEAAAKRRSPPAGLRKPKEIIAEIESLPRLYLLSEPGKTKRFDAVVGPAKTTPDGTP